VDVGDAAQIGRGFLDRREARLVGELGQQRRPQVDPIGHGVVVDDGAQARGPRDVVKVSDFLPGCGRRIYFDLHAKALY
jgi:hypothetical protein